MQIILTPQESELYFHNSLCNSLGYVESGYDLELVYKDEDWDTAKSHLKAELGPDTGICYEDVLLQILKDGNTLTLTDHGYGDYTSTIRIKDVHEKVCKTPIKHLMDAVNEHDDADTGDCILQTVFFGDIIFG